MKPEEIHGTITFQNFLSWYLKYAKFVHEASEENRRSLDRDEDLIETLDCVLHVVSGPAGAKTIIIPLNSSVVTVEGEVFTISLDSYIPGEHGMHCDLSVDGKQRLRVTNTSSSVSETWITVDGTPLDPTRSLQLHEDSLIKICGEDGSDADIIAEIAARGMYHPQGGHTSGKHEFRIPTRKELEIIFMDALEAQEAKAAVLANAFSEVKANHSVLEWGVFQKIIATHPDIFGPNWHYKAAASAYVRFRVKCREAGLDSSAPPIGSVANMLLEGQDAVGCRLEIFWEDGQSKKSALDLQPFLIFAKLTTHDTLESKETSNVERHSLFGENRKNKKGHWHSGVVDLFDSKTKKYHFTYDDDMDEWWYDLSQVKHRFKGFGVIQKLAGQHALAEQFAAFASIAFSVALQRRHYHQRLDSARQRHHAREQLKNTHGLARLEINNKNGSQGSRSQQVLEESERSADIHHSDKVVATIVTIMYLLYPNLCAAAFSLAACQPIGNSNASYVQADLEVQCFGKLHLVWFLLLCLPALLVLVAGIPLFTLALLRRYRYKMHHRRTRFRYGILVIGYKEEAYYWELAIAARKLITAAIGVYMLRADPSMQALSSEILVVTALVLHLTVVPYHEVTPTHNTLQNAETMALTVSFVTLVCGIALTESNVKYGTFYTFVIVSTNCLFLGCGLWWYFVLMRMDLENMIEKLNELHFCSNSVLKCLSHLFPVS